MNTYNKQLTKKTYLELIIRNTKRVLGIFKVNFETYGRYSGGHDEEQQKRFGLSGIWYLTVAFKNFH